ncbi:MAG: TusE/DsrC/DsvC family sulfur relay protein [Bacteroidales bacterium]|nr:TusE/DsrC/DsvC family sulfur relay protein [Bacteroidales bacterium]
MPHKIIDGQTFEVDEDGYLKDPACWNEDVAVLFAKADGITELTKEHWKVIHVIRKYYEKQSKGPVLRFLCDETGFKLIEIYKLFPLGPAKGACKVAGLPKPFTCD